MSDLDKDFDSSDDESSNPQILTKKKTHRIESFHNTHSSDSDADSSDNDSDDEDITKLIPKKSKSAFDSKNDDHDDNGNGNDDEDDNAGILDDDNQYFGFLDDENEDMGDDNKTIKKDNYSKLDIKTVKKLTPEQLEKQQKKIKKTGVVYLSSLPPYMKPMKLRQIMSRFGEIGRIFLKPEDPKTYKNRVKSGGNKRRKFDEGWCEFLNKKDAKIASQTLNGNILGGKKRGFYHDDVMNVKYLKGFKWFDLTNALNREIEVRESKMQAELSQAQKLNKTYIKNVETNKTIQRVKENKKRKPVNDDHVEIRRNFKQRSVATNRANADKSMKMKSDDGKLEGVLNKIF